MYASLDLSRSRWGLKCPPEVQSYSFMLFCGLIQVVGNVASGVDLN